MKSNLSQQALVAFSVACAGLVPVSALFGQALELRHSIGGGHTAGPVTCAAFSPDGKMLASGASHTVILWDLASRRDMAAFEHAEVACLAFSPNGHTLASGGAPQGGLTTDTRIKLWNVATGQGLSILKGHESGVACLSFSPDGKTLASGGLDGKVKLWDIATASNRATFEGHQSRLICMAFSPDGKTVACGGENTIAIWNVAGQQNTATLQGESSLSLVFSPDGKTLASGGKDAVKLWDVATSKSVTTLRGSGQFVNSLVFGGDGKTLVSACRDCTVQVWELTGMQSISSRQCAGSATAEAFFSNPVLSTDGKMMALLASRWGDQPDLKLWDVATGKQTAALKGHCWLLICAAYTSDGKVLVAASHVLYQATEVAAMRWDVASAGSAATQGFAAEMAINSVGISSDARRLAIGCGTRVEFWDPVSGKKTGALEPEKIMMFEETALSPDGKMLATSSLVMAERTKSRTKDEWDWLLTLWDAASGKAIGTLPAAATSMAFSPDGKILAAVNGESITLWDVASRKKTVTFQGSRSTAGAPSKRACLAFAPDGKTLAFAATDKTIKLGDVAGGKVLGSLSLDSPDVRSLAFTPDGKTLAASTPGTITLWNVARAERAPSLAGNRGDFLTFSPDGKTLASWGGNRIQFWDVRPK